MLIRSVTAHSFGPLVEQRLDFADGMTVVHGANESAKSSWHAAIYAALCGRRRGTPTLPERRFADLHRPWDREDWVVRAEVVLDDGRRLEVRQDLAGRVDCDVRDLDLGRDCSAEFISGGTPDLARWLGLDRHSFLATACVAQAQVLAIHGGHGDLQEQLQRAAATAGADQTAAAALAHIEAFRRDRIGTDRAATKPLRLAGAAVGRAELALERAQTAHSLYERRLVEVDGLRAAAVQAQRLLNQHEAVALIRGARALVARADEVDAVLAEVGDAADLPVADAMITDAVTVALSSWDTRPPEPATDPVEAAPPGPEAPGPEAAPPGPEAEASRSGPGPEESTLDRPGSADGQIIGQSRGAEPSPSRSAVRERQAAEHHIPVPHIPEHHIPGHHVGVASSDQPVAEASAFRGDAPPPDEPYAAEPSSSDPPAGPQVRELWDLARDLDVVPPAPDPRINERVESARASLARADGARTRGRRLLLVAAGVLVVAVALALAGMTVAATPVVAAVGAGVVAAALGLAIAGLRTYRAGDTSPARRDLDAALVDAAAALRAEQAGVAQRERAQTQARRWGLPADADAVRQLAQTRVANVAVAQRDQEWQRQFRQTQREAAQAQRLAEQRAQEQVARARREADDQARRQTEEAERRIAATRQQVVEAQLLFAESQQLVEANRRRIIETRRRIAEQVLAAAHRCGIAADDPDDAVIALRRWRHDQADRRAAHDLATRRWSRLRNLLGLMPEATVAQIRSAAADARRDAEEADRRRTRAASAFTPAELDAVTDADPATIDRLLDDVRAADKDADAAEGSRQALAETLVPVGEAEEELARAQAEVARLRELDETLVLTRTFLAAAQERAHRTIAPVLVGTVGAWLPTTTAGRYTDVIVDPQRLRVQVRGPAGRWRDAELLSHGTAEQVYLLLRIALAEHLARPGTVCPLLLDDVTVHADTQRTEQILELLLAAAEHRQIILFSQQDQVHEWASTRLDGPRHLSNTLPPLTTV